MEATQYPNIATAYTLVELVGKGVLSNEVWRATVSSEKKDEVAVKIVDLEEYNQDKIELIRVRTINV
jgi:DNA primase